MIFLKKSSAKIFKNKEEDKNKNFGISLEYKEDAIQPQVGVLGLLAYGGGGGGALQI